MNCVFRFYSELYIVVSPLPHPDSILSYLIQSRYSPYSPHLSILLIPGVAGEMFTSAASYDPTFWPLHGAMERLLNLKRIYVAQKEDLVFDEAYGWPEYNPSDPAAYLYGRCVLYSYSLIPYYILILPSIVVTEMWC